MGVHKLSFGGEFNCSNLTFEKFTADHILETDVVFHEFAETILLEDKSLLYFSNSFSMISP